MRSRFAAPLLLLAALAAVPAAAQVEGRYQLVGINGHALPAPSPTEDGVTVTRAAFWFERDGRASVGITASASDGPAAQRTAGAYVADGDSLRLTTDDGDGPVTYGWARQGDTLRLYDEQQNVYVLLREPAVASDPWTPGTWNAVQVNGQALPTPWPHIPDVTVTDMTFTFGGDGQATIRRRATRGGEAKDEAVTAAYEVRDDRLVFLDGRGGVDEAFAWTLQDGTLRLMDQYGHVYTLTRPWPPAIDRRPSGAEPAGPAAALPGGR
jgi:hypothetical protein